MQITRITAWSFHNPYAEGAYRMSGDRISTGMDSVIVRVTGSDGTIGLGESGTVPATFDHMYHEGTMVGLEVVAPAVIGADPRSPASVLRRMNAVLTGQPYAKAALDMAVWDLAARLAGVPLWQYLGGDGAEETPLYRPVQGPTPDDAAAKAVARVAQGYHRLQVKVGDDPLIDAARVHAVRDAVGPDVVIYADANCGFPLWQARRFVRALGDTSDVFLEQPCATLAECAALRDSWSGPMVMDECNVSLQALIEARRLGIADGVTIKITRVGGITPAAVMRAAAVELGVAVTMEDAGGGYLAETAHAHLNASTPARYRAHTVDFGGWGTTMTVDGPLPRQGSVLRPHATAPGLGLELLDDQLGAPFLDRAL